VEYSYVKYTFTLSTIYAKIRIMDVNLLQDIGLTKVQAIAYSALVASGNSNAPKLAPLIDESRSNTYKILDRLCELGLATKDETKPKISYYPASPAALEQIIRSQAAELTLRERKLNAAMPNLIYYYSTHSEQASVRYFQGKEGMQRIFSDMLKTGEPLYLLRSPSDKKFYANFFGDLKRRRRALEITTYALTPDVPSANHDPAIDAKDRLMRTWLPADAYTASVEWNVSGNKVALISYGEEAMGIMIESPQIAESFRQIFQLVQRAQTTSTTPESTI
jgi:sugar-specific transcriptional regulator TrmB